MDLLATALIGMVTALLAAYAAHFLKKKDRQREVRQAEEKAIERQHRERLVDAMSELRETSRTEIANFRLVQDEIERSGVGLSREVIAPLLGSAHEAPSLEFDRAALIGGFYADIGTLWSEYSDRRARWSNEVRAYLNDPSPDAAVALRRALRELERVRRNLVAEMRAAALDMGFPILDPPGRAADRMP
ncbi:hypothetical protein [Kitasatospora sp. NPDC002040]|uniref:hypothetical protein n=1 Tax=Kitasatospora sp. NPDC002040 TaxID=3154661 RepID=UPI0033315825